MDPDFILVRFSILVVVLWLCIFIVERALNVSCNLFILATSIKSLPDIVFPVSLSLWTILSTLWLF